MIELRTSQEVSPLSLPVSRSHGFGWHDLDDIRCGMNVQSCWRMDGSDSSRVLWRPTCPYLSSGLHAGLFSITPLGIDSVGWNQKTDKGFREVLVDIDESASVILVPGHSPKPRPLRFVLSPAPTLASQTLLTSEDQKLQSGSRLERSPASIHIAHQLGQLLHLTGPSHPGGAGLVIDYGDSHSFGNSLRVKIPTCFSLLFLHNNNNNKKGGGFFAIFSLVW